MANHRKTRREILLVSISKVNIFPFGTEENSYIYDPISNNIVRVNKFLKELVIALYSSNQDEIFRKLKFKAIYKKAFKSLKILQEKYNTFKNHKIKGFSLPFKVNDKNLKQYREKNLNKLSLGITEECNLRCEYCSYSGKYYKERIHSNKFMNLKVAGKAIDFFMNTSRSKQKMINFYGGEPLLVFDLIKDIVSYCKIRYKHRDYIFSLSINGTLINNKIASFLISNDFLCYTSLDGPEDIHDRYRVDRKGRGSFHTILKNLELIRSLKETYYKERVIFLITLSPPCDLIKVRDFLTQNELVKENLYSVNSVNMSDTTFFEDKNPKEWKLEESVKILKEEFIQNLVKGEIEKVRFHLRYFLEPLIRIHKRRREPVNSLFHPNGICIPGGRKLFVNTQREFKICEKLDNFLSIGDIFRGFYYNKIKYLVNKYISFCNEECRSCWVLSLCDLCFVHSNKIDDISIDERRKFCDKVRKRFEKSLILYTTVLEKNVSAFDFLKKYNKNKFIMED